MDLLTSVINIAEQAANDVLEIYNTDFKVENKTDHSPLTAADMASHSVIKSRLSELDDKLPVLSEESSDIPFTTRQQWDSYWLVDPLDGTKEFIKRNGEFTVNIALIQNRKPVLGVVYVPVSGCCYYADLDHGAFKKEKGSDAKPIKVKQTSKDHLVVTGSRSHGNERQSNFMKALGNDTQVITIGSSLKFCLVAEGTVDIYPRFGPTSEWDTAAAQCIVEQAGGSVTTLNLEPLRYNTKDSYLNPEFLVIADTGFDWQSYL